MHAKILYINFIYTLVYNRTMPGERQKVSMFDEYFWDTHTDIFQKLFAVFVYFLIFLIIFLSIF